MNNTTPAEQPLNSKNPLRDAVGQIRKQLPIMVLFSLAINLLILSVPIYMLTVVDRALSSGSLETLFFITVIAGVAVLAMGLLETVRGQFLERLSSWLDRRLGPHVLSATVDGALKDGNHSSQPFVDLTIVRRFIGGPGIMNILDAPWAPIFIIVIWIVDPMLGAIALFSAIILLAIVIINELVSREPQRRFQANANERMQQAGAVVTNAEVFSSMGMLPGFLSNWCKDGDRATQEYLVASDRSSMFFGMSKFVRMFAQILILGGGAYLVIGGQLTAGGMIAVSILLGRALAPVEQAIGSWKTVIDARESWHRLKERLNDIEDLSDTLPLPAPRGDFACEGVTFYQFGREDAVLNSVSFALEEGEALGIIGPSASGKSTLCKLLVGTWRPTRGHVRLDGADLCRWPRERLGPYIGYLPQDIELFSATVTDNICRLTPDPDPQAVVQAAILAGVHEMILSLPDGYETQIGDGGAFLSGGQRQRIGLARALYGDPKLIVLDEPNASLDTLGEKALVEAIDKVKARGATVIIVAHQPYILRGTDKLLVMMGGRARRFGPTAEVLPELANLPNQGSTVGQGAPQVETTAPQPKVEHQKTNQESLPV